MNDLQKIKIARNKSDKKKDLFMPKGCTSLPPLFTKEKLHFYMVLVKLETKDQK
jgi:hypothetical protein